MNPFVPVGDIAKSFGLEEKAARRIAKALPRAKVGRRTLVRVDDVVDAIEARMRAVQELHPLARRVLEKMKG